MIKRSEATFSLLRVVWSSSVDTLRYIVMALKSLLVRRRPRTQVQKPPSPEREESFELLDRCPDIRWKRTLIANQQNLRHEIRMKDVLPGFRSFLTNVEYLRVEGSDKADNIDQVDQLFRILLTKEKREFEDFLVALWQQGYADSAARLAEEAGGRTMSDVVCVCVCRSQYC